ncbi:GH25 family lysozyme [uncultured Anaerofustis sp.]|uniref:GH25 family lysozyme n=1 Tax=uncultured Anaerofustis sp. TaxID=904996 RepID=UPI0025E2EAF4|nr:GH25 family lysozyme [uncultured Anaerofustis sp.]
MKEKLIKILAVCFSFIMCISAASVVSAASEHKGIDVSVWQGDINFREVKDDGIDYVYIRAGEGTTLVDSKFDRNYRDARREGMKLGFYHYVTARDTKEAKDQAHFFYSLIRDKRQDLRPAMDFEQLTGLSKKEANDIARVYMDTLEKLMKIKPAFYSNAYDCESVWEEDLTKYPLWVADYGVERPYSIGHWKDWSGFQYSSRGSVRGIHGHTDMDRFKDELLITDKEKEDAKCTKEGYLSYTVKEGETLRDIAKKFDTTTRELIKLNHLELIHPGEKLIIRK